MKSKSSALNEKARKASREARPWIEPMARAGYAAKGTVYLVVGGLAALAAAGLGGSTTGPRGAFDYLATRSLGAVCLPVIGAGLFAYALWRFVQAACDPECRGTSFKALVTRVGFIGLGLLHLSLAWAAIGLLLGARASSGGNFEKEWTAKFLAQPRGQWLVLGAGFFVAGTSAYQFYRAWTAKFEERLENDKMGPAFRRWTRTLARLGLTARGIAFAIISWFLTRAAVTYHPSEAGGLGDALQVIAEQPWGRWLLALMAAGLMAYGFFALIEARFRRIFGPRQK